MNARALIANMRNPYFLRECLAWRQMRSIGVSRLEWVDDVAYCLDWNDWGLR
jgi:hypothetical protein